MPITSSHQNACLEQVAAMLALAKQRLLACSHCAASWRLGNVFWICRDSGCRQHGDGEGGITPGSKLLSVEGFPEY